MWNKIFLHLKILILYLSENPVSISNPCLATIRLCLNSNLISIVKFSLVQYSYSIHGYRYTQCRYKECLNTEVSIPSYICHKKQSNYTHHAIVYTCVTYQDMKHILNLIAMEYIHEDWWKEIFCNALQNICKFTVQKLNNESIVWWKMNENVCFFCFCVYIRSLDYAIYTK